MVKICYNEKVIKLSHIDLEAHLPSPDQHHLIVHYPGKVKYLLNYIDKLEKNRELKFLYILAADVKKLKTDFFSQFKLVEAAGGLVTRPDGQVLFIKRRGHWDLPKGKIETGETKKVSALREVKEETGLTEVRIIKKLMTTYHIYHGQTNHRRILKPSYWYLMHTPGGKVIPQVEEDIELVEWKKLTPKLLSTLIPIYSNIIDVCCEYLNLID